MGFSAEVSDWVRELKGGHDAIRKQAAQDVVNEAQRTRSEGGRMRVDTGFLRASLRSSTAAMPMIEPTAVPAEGTNYNFNDTDIITTILSAPPEADLHFGWTASYAAHREYGANGQEPDAFVRTAVQKWPDFVRNAENQLASRLGR